MPPAGRAKCGSLSSRSERGAGRFEGGRSVDVRFESEVGEFALEVTFESE
jgi:hypothetical protein